MDDSSADSPTSMCDTVTNEDECYNLGCTSARVWAVGVVDDDGCRLDRLAEPESYCFATDSRDGLAEIAYYVRANDGVWEVIESSATLDNPAGWQFCDDTEFGNDCGCADDN